MRASASSRIWTTALTAVAADVASASVPAGAAGEEEGGGLEKSGARRASRWVGW